MFADMKNLTFANTVVSIFFNPLIMISIYNIIKKVYTQMILKQLII